MMRHNDHIENDYLELPAEAGKITNAGYEPDDDWLKSALPHFRHAAMREWFLTRFTDPANDTPYNGREGGYLYIHGGPYDAEDELDGRFGYLFDDEMVQAVVAELESDGITEWAPIHKDYDDYFSFQVELAPLPIEQFRKRMTEIDSLIDTGLDASHKQLLRQLLYCHLITALESYLTDTILNWVGRNDEVYKRFVHHCPDYKKEKLNLSEVFVCLENLRDRVEKKIQETVWHRLDKVMPLFSHALNIEMPDIERLMKHISTRHDIIHRGGKRVDGCDVEVSAEMLSDLRVGVEEFVSDINIQIKAKESNVEF